MYVNAERICISLLNTKCKTLRAATQIHAFALKAGLDHTPLLAGKLLLRCAVAISGAALDHARRILLHFPDPDSFMFNTLIRGDPTRSLAVFKDMHRRDASLSDSFTFAFALKSAAASRRLSAGSQLHCRALVHGLGTHLFVATTLVSFYGECGALASARKVFDEMPQRNVVAWNAVLAACFGCGDVAGGEALFGAMPARDVTSWDILLAGYIRAGRVGSAREAFAAMPARDDVSWGSMIAGLARSGLCEETFWLFNELRRAGLAPNEAGLTGALSAAAQAGAFNFGRSLHGFVEKAGLLSTVSVNNALLDAYAKSGHVGLARKVFDAMPEKSIVSWSSMIAALAMHGLGEEAVRVFGRMESSGTRPDRVAFVSILYACSHAGLVDEGERCFAKMIGGGEIEPEIEHYGCMVDLYARSGDLEKAYRFASQMPVPPNAVIWRTLLGACTFHGDVEMAVRAREKLSRLDPTNPGDRVLLSNVYASNGKWNDAESVRRSMSGLGIKKTPGRSIVEVERLVYSFGAGEKGSGPADEARGSLREVTTRLRVEGGYVTEVVGTVLHDVEEEDKEDSVTCHSEKLAVAFAMTRVREGEIIRVVKNLRICGDCHTFMKLVSKVYGLEIVVRDRSRFHSFKGGTCSCRDYW